MAEKWMEDDGIVRFPNGEAFDSYFDSNEVTQRHSGGRKRMEDGGIVRFPNGEVFESYFDSNEYGSGWTFHRADEEEPTYHSDQDGFGSEEAGTVYRWPGGEKTGWTNDDLEVL